jgi:hypothetical protein
MIALFTDTITRLIVEHGELAIFVLICWALRASPSPAVDALSAARLRASRSPVQVRFSLVAVSSGVAGTSSHPGRLRGKHGGRLIDRFAGTRHPAARGRPGPRLVRHHGEAVVLYGRLVPLARAFVSSRRGRGDVGATLHRDRLAAVVRGPGLAGRAFGDR